ncbi:LacI family DNA-binding transcriptional regulator [Vibrio sinensis]|nr:LacI family DNA-binding transcriptional regulator [Vibrio sinensis]
MVKQEDIAKKLNITRTTVARALNDSSHIKAETKALVLRTANEMGYVRNHVSSALRANQAKKVYAFIVQSDASDIYSKDIYDGLVQFSEKVKSFNFELQIIKTDINDSDGQIKALKEILKQKPDGIIITALDKEKTQKIILKSSGTRFISLGVKICDEVLHVGPDYYRMGRLSADIMIQMLSKDSMIFLVETENDHVSSEMKYRGFLDGLTEKSIQLDGPHYYLNIFESMGEITKSFANSGCSSLFSNRYISEIFEELFKLDIELEKSIATGLNNLTSKHLENGSINAAVVEKGYEQSYKAGELMFELLVKKEKKTQSISTGFDIFFPENFSWK